MKPDPLQRVPRILLHKAQDLDYVQVYDTARKRHSIYLGKHGSAEAARRYREVVADILAGKEIASVKQPEGRSDWPTVAQLVLAFLQHAEKHYVDAQGQRSREIDNFAIALKPLLHLHRDTPTDRMGVTQLEAVRQHFSEEEFGHKRDKKTGEIIEGTGKRRCRTYVNATLHRIKQVLRWGVTRKLVPGSVWHEVSALSSLALGRGGLRESKPVGAVPRELVNAVLPHLPSPLAAAVELQWATGMRPAELLQLRLADLDRSGDVWLYRPQQHKGIWRGRPRVVAIGPEAQKILKPLLRLDGGYLISPRDVMAEIKASKRANRKTPLTPSQRARDERNARKEPAVGECYDTNAYRKALHRACDAAKVERWSPHRLRHAKGTELARTEGIEKTRIALGHKDDRVTRRYAVGAELEIAIDVARRHG